MTEGRGFQLVAGVEVPDLTGIREGFSLRHTDQGYQQLTANVSAERLAATVLALARCVGTPGFFVLEVAQEAADANGDRWVDVHYLDGLDHAEFGGILDQWADLLIQDGEVNFGFGSQGGYDQVYVGPYKVVLVFAEEPRKYVEALVELGFGMQDQIRTVWENFSAERPGRRLQLAVDGRTAADCVAALGARGLYLSERRKDPG